MGGRDENVEMIGGVREKVYIYEKRIDEEMKERFEKIERRE